jgi:hypothetical protein
MSFRDAGEIRGPGIHNHKFCHRNAELLLVKQGVSIPGSRFARPGMTRNYLARIASTRSTMAPASPR